MSAFDHQPLLASLQPLLAEHGGASGRCAMIVLRLQGLRQAQLRHGFGFAQEVWQRARQRVVQVLRAGDEVHPFGADAMLLLLPTMRNPTHALLAAARLVDLFADALDCKDRPWHERPVLGVAMYPEHATDAEALCLKAERAHDEALRDGRAYALYHADAASTEIVYGELREAIMGNRLALHLQPLLDLRTRRIVGAEALARWQPPGRAAVPAGEFIAFAEHNDLIAPLTRWSINAALRYAAALRREGEFSIAINLSPRVFADHGFAEQLLGALEIWGVPSTAVIVEITETALLADLALSVSTLQQLRTQGIRVAIDDFGTGYASFAYLRHFPATELKIDRSFIAAMAGDPRTVQLVSAMIDVAHRLGLAAVAEGVEDAATLELLAAMDCDVAQGYHIGRPRLAAEFRHPAAAAALS